MRIIKRLEDSTISKAELIIAFYEAVTLIEHMEGEIRTRFNGQTEWKPEVEEMQILFRLLLPTISKTIIKDNEKYESDI